MPSNWLVLPKLESECGRESVKSQYRAPRNAARVWPDFCNSVRVDQATTNARRSDRPSGLEELMPSPICPSYLSADFSAK
jgi:hypothetical protein